MSEKNLDQAVIDIENTMQQTEQCGFVFLAKDEDGRLFTLHNVKHVDVVGFMAQFVESALDCGDMSINDLQQFAAKMNKHSR